MMYGKKEMMYGKKEMIHGKKEMIHGNKEMISIRHPFALSLSKGVFVEGRFLTFARGMIVRNILRQRS